MGATQFYMQDRWLVLLEIILGVIALLPWMRVKSLAFPPFIIWLSLPIIVVFGYVGRQWLLFDYDLSRDEQMAAFDSWVYGHNRLAWPLPGEWQGEASSLNLNFMLPVARPVAWISAYLPGNAMLRALYDKLVGADLTGPVLTAVSPPLAWACARKLWPQNSTLDRETAALVSLLMVGSGQILITSMTSYAMPAHLALNLLWLWLFLHDQRKLDAAALAVGFIAIGLHQPLFHPLFVFPWIFILLLERRWKRAALYVLGYAFFAAFWLLWPMYVHSLVAGPASISRPGTDYFTRLVEVFSFSGANLTRMALNLLRFSTWQALALPPLMFVGMLAAYRDRKAAALIASLVLTTVIMLIILPSQGHGFGYRYLHGLLGNAALIAGYGWRFLLSWQERLRPIIARTCILSIAVLVPVEGRMAHDLYRPSAEASAKLNATKADYAIVGINDGPFAMDLVFNAPDLSNRPIRLLSETIAEFDGLASRICKPGVTVVMPTSRFYTGMKEYFRFYRTRVDVDPSERISRQSRTLAGAGCRVLKLN